jgi:chaperonin GroES
MSRSEITDLSERIDITKLRPQGDYILLEVMERDRSANGLILPSKEKTECLYGKVLATGPGEYSPRTGEVFPMNIKPGDILMSVQYMGEKVQAVGKKYRLLREHGVWAKLKIDFKSEGDWEITAIEPYRDHILLKMDKEEKSLSGRVFLPANPQAMFRMATLVSAGPGPRDKNTGVTSDMGLSKGDRLIVLRYAGCIVRINGVEHRVASWNDVEGVMDASSIVDVITDPNAFPKPVDDYEVIPDEHIAELNKKTIVDSGGTV